MALPHSNITLHVFMLHDLPALIQELKMTTAPVLYVNDRDMTGPINEWTLVHQVIENG